MTSLHCFVLACNNRVTVTKSWRAERNAPTLHACHEHANQLEAITRPQVEGRAPMQGGLL